MTGMQNSDSFKSLACATAHLPFIAVSVNDSWHFTGLEFKAKWHVGDTPMDIQAADLGGAKALGVLTGVYSRKQLEECGAGKAAFIGCMVTLHHQKPLQGSAQGCLDMAEEFLHCPSVLQDKVAWHRLFSMLPMQDPCSTLAIQYSSFLIHDSLCYADSVTLDSLQDVPAVFKVLNL